MTTFEVKDMTCGHCVSTITKAVRAVDEGAKVQIDLATHRVTIDPTEADAAELSEAIKEAGYTPVAIDTGVARAAASTGPARGRCCGG
ncbi:MAG: heavy-metal-associated domain-containing protein [Burkholderiaceae bacterium]